MRNWGGSRRRRRYRRIATVLARHGLGYFIGVLGLERLLPFQRGLFGHAARDEPYTRPEHLRLVLEELGPAWVKIGQVLSTRPDLLPPEYQRELTKLQDSAPPVAVDQIRAAIEVELGQSPDRLFSRFDALPLAAASIGQAHAAALHDGTEVVVKVRRPGVVEQIEEDLAILRELAVTASRRWERAADYDLVGLADEFAATLRAELDYPREGRSAERFAANFAGEPAVHIPRVFWATTTPGVLTLERISGIKVTDHAVLEAANIDRRALAERASHLLLRMIFEDGFFHADPHPGNFFVEPGGRIGLIDFGMVGTVDERTREQLAGVLLAVSARDADRLVDTFLELGVARRRLDRVALRQDLRLLLERYYDRPLGEIRLGALVSDTLATVRRHHLQLPSDLALLLKTVVMSEGLAAGLDPGFQLTSIVTPYARQLLLRQYSPGRWARRLGQAGLEAGELGIALPRQLRRLLGELERGTMTVSTRAEGLEPVLERLERLANRLVLAIVAAAFVIGLAVLMAVYHPPGWDRWAGPIFAFGFALAAALGAYLAWSIYRSGRS